MASTIGYRGLTYEAAFEEAMRLLREAVRTDRWHKLPEKLADLREVGGGDAV
jgi:hypothetical protein